MSKSLNVPSTGPSSDEPQTKIGKQMTGDDYRQSLLTQAKLEKALGSNSRMIPKRERVFRIADEILKQLNIMDDASEQEPNSNEARQLDQLHHQFGTENVVDLAMILANMQLKKEEKERFKKLTGENGVINLSNIGKNTKSTLSDEVTTTLDHTKKESEKDLLGSKQKYDADGNLMQ